MTSQASRHVARRVVAAPVAALAVLLVATGCGTASDPSPPAGVDGLTVPTPSPDPGDFVDEIDNPWLPLEPGAQWSYDLVDGPGGVAVRVAEEPGTVAGVAVTVVETVATFTDGADGSGWSTPSSTDYYAQDEAGNVWWFGREGEWQAGEDGAEAGIAMLATPRLGDGYVESEPGARAEIVAVDGVAETEAGTFEDLLVVETTEQDGRVLRTYYARDTGLVYLETLTGAPDETLVLVE